MDPDLDREVEAVLAHGRALRARSQNVSPEVEHDPMCVALTKAYARIDDQWARANATIVTFEA